MKAKEVLNKLRITRQTLTKYVSLGYLKVTKLPNGAIGIMRKVTGDESVKDLISRGHALCPFKLNMNNLTKVK